jgi:hypothetical protein
MERVDVRDRRDQRTPGRMNWPSPRTHSRSLLIEWPIPSQHALPLGSQEETRQEIVRLLMCRRVCLKARADTGRRRAVIIRNLHITVTFDVTNCDGGRRTICETSARARSSPPLIN